MALLHSSTLYITLPWLYFTVLDSTLHYHDSPSLYWILHFSTNALLHSTRLYITLPWCYFNLHCSTMALHDTTFLYQG